jgi:ankyrin repeat protein
LTAAEGNVVAPDMATKARKRKELIRSIREAPELLMVPDDMGNLPLHVQLHQRVVDEDLVNLMLQLGPDAIKARGRFGRTPLHCALIRTVVYPNTIRRLLNAYPAACSEKTKGGWIPMHYAADHDHPCVSSMKVPRRTHMHPYTYPSPFQSFLGQKKRIIRAFYDSGPR